MAITSGLAMSFKQEILDGTHEADDDYKIALFTVAANLGPDTTHYSEQSAEVGRGAGYVKGGQTLTGRESGLDGSTAYMTFSNPRWSAASFTARGALIYNASKENRAVAIMNFGQDYTCTNGEFVVSLPAPGASAIVTVS